MRVKLIVLIYSLVYLTNICYSQKQQKKVSSNKIAIELSIDSIFPSTSEGDEVTFKYEIINRSITPINFLTLSIYYIVSDTSGNSQEIGFKLDINDSSKSYLYNKDHQIDFEPANCYCGTHEIILVPPLTKQDTLDHIVLIKPGENYKSEFKLYGCGLGNEARKEHSPSYNYWHSVEDRKKVKIQLIYDNRRLQKDIIYGKKIWIGKIKSSQITE